jgi:hypothetical protein
MRSVRAAWLILTVCLINCGGESKKAASRSSGGVGGDEPKSGQMESSGCPEGFPYCPTLDACLLPGRVCPASAGTGGGPESKPTAGGASGDAPDDPDLPPLPLPSTPAQIRCGQSVCDSETEYCCSGSGGSSVGGGSGFETCSATACPYRRECDETADCVGTEICCYSVVASPPAVLAGSCLQPAACAFDGYWQACGSQADCAATSRPACVAQDCAGATLQTCGSITRSVCKG